MRLMVCMWIICICVPVPTTKQSITKPGDLMGFRYNEWVSKRDMLAQGAGSLLRGWVA